ncbi:MAG: bifunctional folylpolyglutamate synthase/dihydrofolate synthase, partial [Flavobacteriales bacterium]
YFASQDIDVAIIETGMGGRLDSTNVVTPEVSVITNIGLDHTRFLGDTIAKIAGEKAGIIKNKIPVVIGEMLPEAVDVIIAKAKEKEAEVYSTSTEEFEVPKSDLDAAYQEQNLRTAWLALYQLKKNQWPIKAEDVERGFSRVKENTGMRGRWETISTDPKTIVDCAHNIDGVLGVLSSLKKENYSQLHIVIGMVNDKDVQSVLKLFPKECNYYFCKADVPRALDEHELQDLAQEVELKGEVFSSVKSAYKAARLYASSDDLILITGSVFVVAEVL